MSVPAGLVRTVEHYLGSTGVLDFALSLTLTRMIEKGRRKQAVCSNWNPISREIFGNIRSDFLRNEAIPT